MDRTTFITVGICVVLLGVWFFKFGSSPTRPPTPAPTSSPYEENVLASEAEDQAKKADENVDTANKTAAAAAATVDDVNAEPKTAASTNAADAVPATIVADAEYPRVVDEASAPNQLSVLSDSEYLQARIDSQVGGIIEFKLLKHLDASMEQPKRLGHFKTPYLYLLSRQAQWAGDARAIVNDSSRLVIERQTENGLRVRESWTLDAENNYRINYRVEFSNLTGTEQILQGFAVGAGGIMPDDGADTPKAGRVGMMTLGADIAPAGAEAAISFDAKKIGKFDQSDKARLATTKCDWLAIHNKYFIFYVAAADSADSFTPGFTGVALGLQQSSGVAAEGEDAGASRLYGTAALPDFKLPANGVRTFEFTGYAGPKEYRRISLLDKRADSVLGMDFFFFGRARWMGSLSRLVLRSLLKLHDWGLSYGLAIILITMIVKGLFWPLTHKSTVSMRKMQQIQPLVKEIREQHKNDPAVMNQKIMALYKEHKVNPLGGCLPVVCQIPVFLALFNTFRGAIELRHTSFLWVVDLSRPDTLPFELFGLPIRPLPLIMGVCMLLQHHFGPSTADPNQKRMMMFMTIFFMFIFYGMPAGLTLYWTINQLLTMLQHFMLRRADGAKQAGAAAQ